MRFGVRREDVLYSVFGNPLAGRVQKFVHLFCRSPTGRGLVTGAPSSPYLFNLYGEFMLDAGLRHLVLPEKLRYWRYADDLVVSGPRPYMWASMRRKVRSQVAAAGFAVNHRKSKVLCRKHGPVFITGLGLAEDGRIIFPGKKRRQLQGMLRTYIKRGDHDFNVVNGHIAHFMQYVKAVRPTESDKKLLVLCKRAKELARSKGY